MRVTAGEGSLVVACAAPYGVGGLGRHLEELVEAVRRQNVLLRYYAEDVPVHDAQGVRLPDVGSWLGRAPLPWSRTALTVAHSACFDRLVANRLGPAAVFVGFAGQSLHSFRRAARLGYTRLRLESPTAHVDHVVRQQEAASRWRSLDDGWLGHALRRKTLQEYLEADEIWVTSELSLRHFREAGVPANRLHRRTLQPHPRFRPAPGRPHPHGFHVVYVGGLTALKGVPVLVEAFSHLAAADARLTLVGGPSSRTARRWIQEWLRRDSRIRVAPGDPLPHLQSASVCVHPSFTDGLGLAPLEALACGVPVIVTDQTGMCEYVREGVNGFVVAAGSWEMLLDRLEHLRESPLEGVTS